MCVCVCVGVGVGVGVRVRVCVCSFSSTMPSGVRAMRGICRGLVDFGECFSPVILMAAKVDFVFLNR